ncbi:hypothetical protein [Flavobacterium cerinum]|uniref:Uncharacterized protein n=1 Tax=Flavobacterium cerinum TaxID=2502784 RepID=A0A3S3QHM9_9FLAO|nr:hypothetical protein [Flavobacterium cerinum]RWW96719.1 hypothetical protein EPI11_14085 [Flavobacterium cerinum]
MKISSQKNKIRKTVLTAILLIPILSFAQKEDYKKELDIIFETFKTDNYELIEPLIIPEVWISDNIPTGLNDQVIPLVLEQIPSPDSYKILRSEAIGSKQLITTEYHYSDGKTRLQYFTFNANKKIIKLDILRDAKKVETTYGGQN